MTFHEMKLGRQPSRADERTLRAASYMKAVPAAPDATDYSEPVRNVPMLGNDAAGNCTAAALCHQFQTWTAMAQGKEATFTKAEALRLYRSVTGYNPAKPSTDQGAMEIDVLRYVRKHPLVKHKLLAFASVDPATSAEVKQALWVFGGLYIGLDLPLTAQDQTEVWDVVKRSPKGHSTPGSWGGHAVHCNGYDRDGLMFETWDVKMRMTWAFWNKYCSEAWALVSPDWLKSNVTPSGFDQAQLVSDLAALGKVA